MKSGTSKFSSSLIKNSGEVIAPLGGELAAPRNRARVAQVLALKGWAKVPGALITDPRLSAADKLLWQSVELIRYHSQQCEESLEVLAAACGISKRQAVTSIAQLIATGWMNRIRATRNNRPDRLIPVGRASTGSNAKSAAACSRCKADRPVDRTGVCVVCRKSDQAEREVAEQLKAGFAEQTVIWANLKAHGSKSSSKEIGRALLKIRSATVAA